MLKDLSFAVRTLLALVLFITGVAILVPSRRASQINPAGTLHL